MAETPQINPGEERYSIRKLKGFNPGATDMASMIEDAAANALAKSQMLWLPSSIGAYPVSRTVTLPAGLDIWLDGAGYITRTDLSQTEPTVVVGASNVDNTLRTIRLTVRRGSVASQGLTVSNWQDKGCAAIVMHNISDSKIDWGAWRHTVGLELRGTESSCSYNDIYPRKIVGNRIGMWFRAIGAAGWVNQNTVYKGRWSTDSDIYSGAYASYYPIGVLMESTFNGVNSNVFYSPNFEILTRNNQWQDAVCCEIDSLAASMNVFHVARHENDSQWGSRFFRIKSPGCFGNRAIISYAGSAAWPVLAQTLNGPALLEYKINDDYAKLTNTVVSDMFTPVENGPGGWHSGSLGAGAKRCDAAGHISVPGMYWNAGSTRTRYSTGTGHTVPATGKYLRLDGTAGAEFLCIMLDTSKNKRFLIKPNIAAPFTNSALRVFVSAVDSDRTTVLNKFGTVIISGNITNTGGVIGPISVTSAYRGKGYNGAPGWRAYGGSGTGLDITPNMAGTAGADQYIASITVNNGGTNYSASTKIVFDTVPGGDDVRLSSGLPTTFYFGGVQTQGNGAGGVVCEAGYRTQFVEVCVGVTGGSNIADLESISIQTLDQYPIQPANYFLDQNDPTQPWVLEEPQTAWLTNGGVWSPGTYVVNASTTTTDGQARIAGWVYTGNNVFKAVASIADGEVTYAKLQDASAGNVVLARAAATAGDYSEVAIGASQLCGRGSTGNVAAITLGSGLTMSGTTLSASGGGGVSDGDKGDITVSGSGATWTIDNSAVTLAKIANISTARLLGNNSGSSAAPSEQDANDVRGMLGLATTDKPTFKGVVATGGTVTDNAYLFDGSITWNDGTETMKAMRLAITDTASAAASVAFEYTLGGTRKIAIQKDGALQIYPSYTNDSNYGRVAIYTSGNNVQIESQKAGTGSSANITVESNNNTYIFAPSGGYAYLAAGNLVLANRALGTGWQLTPVADGKMTATGIYGGTFFLQLNGTSSSYPAIVRNGADVRFRLADDSANCQVEVQCLKITDGMTAPSATSGVAKIYVDTSDGDLKVIFGDGTVKTIVVDT